MFFLCGSRGQKKKDKKKEWWMQLSFQEREERSLHSQEARQRPVSYRDDRELELTPTLNMCLRYPLWTFWSIPLWKRIFYAHREEQLKFLP